MRKKNNEKQAPKRKGSVTISNPQQKWVVYNGNSRIYEYKSKISERIYKWERQENLKFPPKALIDIEDVDDILSIKGRSSLEGEKLFNLD